MADDNINNGSSDEQLPEDLRRLLDRAQADDSGQDVYDPDVEGEDAEEDDDDGELEEEFGDGGRGVDTGETDEHGGTLQISEFGHEMRQSFIEYSMSVITARALPDVRDGLKPVHRRILYAMNESGIFPNRPHKKSAWTVGEVIGKYHPHGDSAVYEAMVRLAQWFSVRTPLVDGHGNFGNIDGDGAAAMRYTESRLAKPAMELLRDLQKDTVDWQPNYDESLQEPQVLPARFPNLLVNGSSGIAVGMATNIPPHNLGEAVEATCMLIDNPDATTDELMTVMPGPDFPTGAVIMGTDGIREAYETGRGSITVRAKAHVETTKTGRSRLVFTEIPYQVNKGALQEKIAQLVNEKRIEGPDLIQQIQRLVPDDDTFVRAEGHAFCLVDHAVEHIQQALYIFLFHSAVRSFLFVGAGRLNPAAASIPRRPAPVHTFPMAGGSGSSPAPWWS